MAVAARPHPALGALAGLLGDWDGEGRMFLPGRDDFTYLEHCTFSHNGKPFLVYAQQTRALDDRRPLHGESGFWRAAAAGDVELVLAHGIGVVEIELGRWKGPTLRLRAADIALTPTAKHVTALSREYELREDTLRYRLFMGMDGEPPFLHLDATLRRAA